MGTEITITVEDIEKLMYSDVAERSGEDLSLEEWAQEVVPALIYKMWKAQSAQDITNVE